MRGQDVKICKVAYSRATGRIRCSGVYSGSEPKNKLRKTNTAKYASFMDSIFIHDISLTVISQLKSGFSKT